MTTQEGGMPFVLRFAEDGTEPDLAVDVVYDSLLGANVVTLPDGKRVPAVEHFAAGTSTLTEVRAEQTDTDPQSDQSRQALAPTATGTRVRAENTDTDRGNMGGTEEEPSDPNHWTFFGHSGPQTVTVTKAKDDVTDRD